MTVACFVRLEQSEREFDSLRRIVGHGECFAVAQIQTSGFVASEGARAATAKNCDLIAALVYRAIAIDSL